MSKPWGCRVPNKKTAGSQQGPPSQAAPGFLSVHREQEEGAHNSQKYPVDTDLGGQESGARAESQPRVEIWVLSECVCTWRKRVTCSAAGGHLCEWALQLRFLFYAVL